MGAESLAWTLIFILLPLACVYYPVSVLPGWLQWAAWMLPPTYVFEGMRALMIDKIFRADLIIQALAMNMALLVAAFAIFVALLERRPPSRQADPVGRIKRFRAKWAPFALRKRGEIRSVQQFDEPELRSHPCGLLRRRLAIPAYFPAGGCDGLTRPRSGRNMLRCENTPANKG